MIVVKYTYQDIIERAKLFYWVDDIKGRKKGKVIVKKIIARFLREEYNYTLKRIADILDIKQHWSIIYYMSDKKINNLYNEFIKWLDIQSQSN